MCVPGVSYGCLTSTGVTAVSPGLHMMPPLLRPEDNFRSFFGVPSMLGNLEVKVLYTT